MLGQRAFGNVVIGNLSGTDRTGTTGPGNRGHGISMEMGAWGNLVQGNLTSGNDRVGVNIGDEGSNFNTIIGNIIGADVTGTKALPNGEGGINASYFGASFNRIGGTAPGEGNLIDGNHTGIFVQGPGSEGNLIIGNSLGATISGSGAVGTATYNAVSVGTAVRTMIGGASPAEGNIIARAVNGIAIHSDFNFVLGNRITLGATEPAGSGVYLDGEHNWVQGNVIGGKLGQGVQVDTGGLNTIRRNLISGYVNKAVELKNGGNGAASAPTIGQVTRDSVSGTAEPGALIEVYSVAVDGAVYFEGETMADSGGAFTFKAGQPFRGPKVLCTATDAEGNTSEVGGVNEGRVLLHRAVTGFVLGIARRAR
ncbi:MAG: Ig-like domain-containing protein [Bacillota bacterium]